MIKIFGNRLVVHSSTKLTMFGENFSMLRIFFDPEGSGFCVDYNTGTGLLCHKATAAAIFNGFCSGGNPCETTKIDKQFVDLNIAMINDSGIDRMVVSDNPKELVDWLFHKHADIRLMCHLSTLDGKLRDIDNKEVFDAMAFIVKEMVKVKDKTETEEATLAKAKTIEEARKKNDARV